MEKRAYNVKRAIDDVRAAMEILTDAYYGLVQVYSEYTHPFLFDGINNALENCDNVMDWLKQERWRSAEVKTGGTNLTTKDLKAMYPDFAVRVMPTYEDGERHPYMATGRWADGHTAWTRLFDDGREPDYNEDYEEWSHWAGAYYVVRADGGFIACHI